MAGAGLPPLVAVIATGGTIASRRDVDGSSTPDLDGGALLARLRDLPPVRLRPVDLFARDSSTLGLAEMQAISDAVGAQLADPEVAGVVILHGTDSMEETSLLVSLQHRARCPVVFTGAQFTDDHPQADGPANMAAAIRKALSPEAGVHLVFGGRDMPVWGIHKHSADDPDAFRPCGANAEGPWDVHLPASVAGLRVALVAVAPGGDALHIEASLAAGAHGIVLVALGSGNATPAVVAAVRRCVEVGVPVVTSSRVPQGRLAAGYGGGGGGHDLVQAGALHAARLRPGQARILLAALIAEDRVGSLGPQLFGHP
ncbi:asparaginase [Falsirhodobacter sp. 20TX0035]|uniref:asparaginase n=1 Tax=Falsirhodobacter sp. 20TX0035 TaxID=3022019 RepID=UPI00232D2808|nr:asparaginase [Falsirhodobacter sp. 20TX0035]MDB6452974.1 asparaginase [Falsirhodobacter sp. 20TX0035]